MSRIHRVNVTSATSVPRYDAYGERIAEVEMQLPANIVNAANVTEARMAVTKLKTSLANIPACSVPVSYVSDLILRTPFKVLCVPIKGPRGIDRSLFEFFRPSESPEYFKRADELSYSHILVPPEHATDPVLPDEAKAEAQRGYHNFEHITDFLNVFSNTVWQNISSNYAEAGRPSNPGNLKFNVNSDNTITLQLDTRETEQMPLPYNSGLMYYSNEEKHVVAVTRTGSNWDFLPTDFYLIGVNKELRDKLPTLPWKRYSNREEFGNWNEKYIYFLNTDIANLSVLEQETLWYRGPNQSYKGVELKFTFAESDAVTISDVSSLILCMNGADFNNQVLPVNISASTIHAAQTTSVPIIDFYFPLWSRPSDMTTDFIVRQDEFSVIAPTNISPSLLRERSIRFKLYYVTTKGDMREMTMPSSSVLAFQLCIETI